MEPQSSPSIAEVRTEGLPGAVASPAPRISWKTAVASPGWRQVSAEVRLHRDGDVVSAHVGTDSVEVPWPFVPLRPREEVALEVRVCGEDERWSPWSAPLLLRAGFLADGEWAADFIGLDRESSVGQPALLRARFVARGHISRATLYATARGAYQVRINGREVDDAVLKPGWTSYQYRLLHETTDVTTLVDAGDNLMDISLAGGWYTENYSDLGPGRPFYGVQASAAAQLVIEYSDGGVDTVLTDETWMATGDGPLRSSSIYDGEAYDARRAPLIDASWSPVRVDPRRSCPPHRGSGRRRRHPESCGEDDPGFRAKSRRPPSNHRVGRGRAHARRPPRRSAR